MPSHPPTEAEVLRSAVAVAAEDEERAGVAMFLGLQPAPATPADPSHPVDPALGHRLGAVWDVLAAHDPDVTVQDALAVLADLEFRSGPPRSPVDRAPDRLAAWRPAGWRTPPRAQRDAEVAEVRDALVGGRLLRVVNYHDTPLSRREEFRTELHGYAARFDPVTAADVLAFFATGRWATARPGIVPAFFDGFASAVHCAAPLLAETGLTGWFYPPTEFLDVAPPQQRAFAQAHDYGVLEHPDGRLAMTWDELADLAGTHEVCGHTATHAATADVRTDDDVTRQVREPVRRLTEVCGRVPAAWAWLGGTPFAAERPGDRAVVAEGVALLTSNAVLERLPVP